MLQVARDGLLLQCTGSGAPGPIRVDLVSAAALRRARAKDQALLRAIGRRCATIVDTTTGLGRDTWSLAAAGYQVTAVERHPVLHAMLADALERAATHPVAAPYAARITLLHIEAETLLRSIANLPALDAGRPDVVYLDPMFEPSDRSAQVKKEMQTLRRLLPAEDPAAQLHLLELGRAAARRQVVVKRHHGQPPLRPAPTRSVKGRSVRFDVYLVAS